MAEQLERCSFFRNIIDSTEDLDFETQALVSHACLVYGITGEVIEQLEENKLAKALFKALKANIDVSRQYQIDGKKGGRPRKKKSQEEIEEVEEAEEVEESEDENDITAPAAEKHAGGTDVIKHGQHGNVRLSKEDYNTLVKDHGKEDTEEAIEILDAHIETLAPKEKRNYLRRNHKGSLEYWGYRAVEERRAEREQLKSKVRNFVDLRGQRDNWANINQDYPPEYFDTLEKMIVEN